MPGDRQRDFQRQAQPCPGPRRRHQVHDLRLDHVDAGVDGVAEDFAPGGLLLKPKQPSIIGGYHHAVLQRIGHPVERERGIGTAFAVEVGHPGQIDIGNRVAADHQERLSNIARAWRTLPAVPSGRSSTA
jgi:hypothetical protein